jgi:PAS domain S-box-containing protein
MLQPSSAIHDAKPLRSLFAVLLGFLVLTYLIAVSWHWTDVRRDAEAQLRYINSILVQNTRATLKNYELVLESAGSELVAAGALDKPERGRALAERLRAIDPGMVSFGLARPDGQFVLLSGVASGQPLPNLAQSPETRDSFHKSLQTGRIQPGRPYYMSALGKWIIPVRAPIADDAGRTVAVMTAGYAIEGGTLLLANAALPPRTLTALLRDDGYLQYAYPLPAELRSGAANHTYGRRISEETRRQILAFEAPSGTTLIHLPRLHGWFLLAYQNIDEYGLSAGAFMPLSAVLLNWAQRLLLPTALLGTFLLSAIWAYRRAVARQAASNDTVSRLANWRQAVLDAAQYSMISTDTAGTIISFNAAAQRMLGYRPEEVVGKATPVLFHDADELRRHADALGAPVQPGFDVFAARPRKDLPEEGEWTYVRKDGSRFPVRLAVTALHGPDGRIEGFLGIADDLSERAAARADLLDSETRYHTLFEHIGDGIFLLQGERVIDCNPAALALFGCPRESLVGSVPYRFSPAFQPDGQASRDKAHALIQKALAGEAPFFEWRHARADGTCFDAEVTLNRAELGGEPHILATVRDITGRKETERELTRSRQALLDRNESLRLINQLSERVHASLSLDDILQEALDALQGLSRAAHIAIHLLNDDILERAASRGFDEAFLRLVENVPLADSLCGAAVAARRPLISADVADDARASPQLRDAAVAAGLRTCGVIPMIYNERALGSLVVAYGDGRRFNDDDLGTLNALGNTVALAVANARHVVSLAF